jgi:hypothetical protein
MAPATSMVEMGDWCAASGPTTRIPRIVAMAARFIVSSSVLCACSLWQEFTPLDPGPPFAATNRHDTHCNYLGQYAARA